MFYKKNLPGWERIARLIAACGLALCAVNFWGAPKCGLCLGDRKCHCLSYFPNGILPDVRDGRAAGRQTGVQISRLGVKNVERSGRID